MNTHKPKDYICPLCRLVNGIEDEHVISKQSDIIFQNNSITAFISSHWWPNNPGHVIIIPNSHIENIYSLPDDLSDEIHRLAKRITIAMKSIFKCDGTSTRQHNEPAGDQDVLHYHLHIFPRYKNDNLYKSKKSLTNSKERITFANKFKEYFKNN